MSFTIITREAKVVAGEVHDRMPVFLYEELMNEWLASGKLEKDEREHLHDTLDDPAIVLEQSSSLTGVGR